MKTTEKYLVKIEFRYSDAPKDYVHTTRSKHVTIGVYDTFEEACENGNKLLEKLESKFKLHEFPSGESAEKKRFSRYGGPFRTKNTLVTNLAYLKTPFEIYADIETLKYDDIDEAIAEVLSSVERYREYVKNQS